MMRTMFFTKTLLVSMILFKVTISIEGTSSNSNITTHLRRKRSSPQRNFKKGQAIWTAQSCNALVDHTTSSWWYSWGPNNGFTNIASYCKEPTAAVEAARASGMEFVPMFWASVPSRPFEDEIEDNLQQASYLLTFNEPEHLGQADMSPLEAALEWQQIESIADDYNLQIAAPCMTQDKGFQWFDEWEMECNMLYGRRCRYDYGCLHLYYQPYPCDANPDFDVPNWACIGENASRAKESLQRWYNTVHNKPLWVNEYACAPWDDMECNEEAHMAIHEQLTPVLEQSDYVFRYSFYATFGSDWVTNSLNELFWSKKPNMACKNIDWLGAYNQKGATQVSWKLDSMSDCVSTAEASPECHRPLIISGDGSNCYCSLDDCSNMEPSWLTTSFNLRSDLSGSSSLTILGEAYNDFGSDGNWEIDNPTGIIERNPKKGQALWETQSCNALVEHTTSSWWYSWGPSDGFSDSFCNSPRQAVEAARESGMEFVPMFRNEVPPKPFADEIEYNLQQATHLLTFNEPEISWAANLSPREAAETWEEIEDIAEKYNLQLVAPCMSQYQGRQWFEDWELECNLVYGRNCQYDYGCLHLYYQPFPCDANPDFDVPNWACIGENALTAKTALEEWYLRFNGKQVWVNEYACSPSGQMECSEESHMAIHNQLTPVLEESEYVYRYSFYATFGSDWVTNSLNELVWSSTPDMACKNLQWLSAFNQDHTAQVAWKLDTIGECVLTAEASPECHRPLRISADGSNCYCSLDDCSIMESSYLDTIIQVKSNLEDSSLTVLGNAFNQFGLTLKTDSDGDEDEDFPIIGGGYGEELDGADDTEAEGFESDEDHTEFCENMSRRMMRCQRSKVCTWGGIFSGCLPKNSSSKANTAVKDKKKKPSMLLFWME